MKKIIYILIGLFVLCGTNSYGQLFKKKNGSVSATRKSSTSSGGTRDAFTGKSKKGPNIYSSKGPRSKSKSKLYQHSISKKRLKKKNKSVFSSKKRRYKFVNSKPPKDDQGAKSSKGGRKSGKGRKK